MGLFRQGNGQNMNLYQGGNNNSRGIPHETTGYLLWKINKWTFKLSGWKEE
jgi:hypothetical protein